LCGSFYSDIVALQSQCRRKTAPRWAVLGRTF